MARQVLPIVGAVAGFMITGTPQGAQWGYIAGTVLGNAVDPQTVRGPRLGEAGLQTSAEGVFRPVVFGTAPVQGNIIHRGNHRIVRTSEGGGKGGSPEVEPEREYWTFAIRISEGKIAGLLRIWEDEKLVYDARPGSEIPEETAAYAERFTLYLGDEEQEPDPDLEAYMGAGNVNAYRGTAYAVFPNYDTTSTRRIPTFRFEVASQADAGQVVTAMALGIGSGSPGNTRVTTSPDGQDWDTTPSSTDLNAYSRLIGLADRYVIWGNSGAAYTMDGGATLVPSTEDTHVSAWPGVYAGGVLMIRGNNGELQRSLDGGVTFISTPWPDTGLYGAGGSFVIAIQYGVAHVSMDAGASWTAAGPIPADMSLANGVSFAPDGAGTLLGARTLGAVPAVYFTANGIDYSSTEFSDSTGTFVSLVLVGDEVALAFTDTAEIYRRIGGVWSKVAHALPDEASSGFWNGTSFTVGGGFIGGGFIETSVDGESWTSRTQPFDYEVTDVATALPPPPAVSGEPVALSSIVAALHARAGQPAGSFSAAVLTDLVDGVVFAGDYTCADAIRTLAGTYFFDAPEYDAGAGYKIQYTPRGGPVSLTLSEGDLIAIPDEQTRMDPLERPRVLHLHYQSPTVGYAPAKASPQRFSPDVRVVGEASVQTPVCFADQDEAWRRADIMLKQAWAEVGGEMKVSVPWSFLELVASTPIGVSLRGQARRYRIDQLFIGDGVLDLTLIVDRQSAWTSNLTGPPLPEPTPPPPSIVGQAIGAELDIPARIDTEDRLVQYLAITGQTEAFYGGVVQRSLDAGANWAEAGRTPPIAVMGVLQDTVTAASEYFTDATNSVRVRLYRPGDELESLTDQQFLSEGGAFALSWMDGDTRRWELMQYRDVEQDSDGDWILTTLLRGRANTPAVEHPVGSLFVRLDRLIVVDTIPAWLGQALTHRFISFGGNPESAMTTTSTYTGRSQIEFPVAHVRPARLDADTIRVRPVPRHRFGTELNPIRSINWNGYRYMLTDGVNNLARDSLSDDETFDTTGWGSPITVTVAQLNRITGAGPTVSEDIA